MARRRSGPWQRKQGGGWYTTIGRQVRCLGAADDPWEKIEAEYHRLHASGGEAKPAGLTVAGICGAFLDFTKSHRAAGTYEWYKRYVDEFVAEIGPALRVESLTPGRVADWIRKRFGAHSGAVQNHAARGIVRAMNWAVKERLIRQSPLVGFVKPAASTREAYVTPAEYAVCLEHAAGPFLDALVMLWHSGCRPQELRLIEAAWIDGDAIVFPVAKSKGQRRRRVIFLDGVAKYLVDYLAAANPTGAIFRNRRGRPWHKDAMNCAFRRLRKETGIKKLCAYAFRHGFATRALKQGVDGIPVGVLMGHANPGMVAKIYQHVADDAAFMVDTLRAINAGNGAAIGRRQAALV